MAGPRGQLAVPRPRGGRDLRGGIARGLHAPLVRRGGAGLVAMGRGHRRPTRGVLVSLRLCLPAGVSALPRLQRPARGSEARLVQHGEVLRRHGDHGGDGAARCGLLRRPDRGHRAAEVDIADAVGLVFAAVRQREDRVDEPHPHRDHDRQLVGRGQLDDGFAGAHDVPPAGRLRPDFGIPPHRARGRFHVLRQQPPVLRLDIRPPPNLQVQQHAAGAPAAGDGDARRVVL
mmetsp:Transcript_12222/g.34924  ORF Transcript_12222/g.34924 Transcript_12222/m.34924 type:complete len:231 (-) Transcript_12222:431-1123(-)